MSDTDPIARFQKDYAKAQGSEVFDAGRCALATVSQDGVPSVRFVLLKAVDVRGFVFYTNFESHKAADLRDNPNAALAFHWHTIGVQVRVRGTVTRVSDEEADAYFASRDRGSQLGAWASRQSAPLSDRAELERAAEEVAARFENVSVTRPPFWGGYRVAPESIEFWQTRDDRLHDRWLYQRDGSGWRCTLLSP